MVKHLQLRVTFGKTLTVKGDIWSNTYSSGRHLIKHLQLRVTFGKTITVRGDIW